MSEDSAASASCIDLSIIYACEDVKSHLAISVENQDRQ